ncbi:hypothetical protein GALL_494720 [mine drainage metagenome]|uniref:Uncharacterized protein n=1 Tax=mine drainage metagenome TaxID=410659 RepID=A0A1J5PMW1_9ZZZZ
MKLSAAETAICRMARKFSRKKLNIPLKKFPMLRKKSENQLKPEGSVKASGSLPT